MNIELDERTTAIGLFHFAHSYAASAIVLTQHPVRATHKDAPIRFLFSHAAELYLKAFCRMHGLGVAALRSRAFGHDLPALLQKAVELGLAVDTDLHTEIQTMNDAIEDRYISTGFRQAPSTVSMCSSCKSLNNQIGPLIYEKEGLTRIPPSLC